MELTAIEVGGARTVLPPPCRLDCSSSWEIPADSLEAEIPLIPPGNRLGEIASVELVQQGHTLFNGLVDEQTLSFGPQGGRLTLQARSRAAILIDNEAIPQTFYHPSLHDIFQAHAAQYGFSGILAQDNPTLNTFTVAKGKSEWQAIESFCRQTLGVTPYVRDGWLVAKPRIFGAPRMISNTVRGGLRYRSLSVCRKRYAVISKVILKSERKLYDVAIENPAALAREIRRKRYISPPKEWAGNPRDGALRLMRDSMRKALLVTVELPGLAQAQVGERFAVADGAADYPELVAYEVRYQAGSAGSYTLLRLVLPDYLS